MVETQCMQVWSRWPADVEMSIWMGKKGDLSDFEHGMAVSARWAALSISEPGILQSYHLQDQKGENNWWAAVLLVKFRFLMPEVKGEVSGCFKLIRMQH